MNAGVKKKGEGVMNQQQRACMVERWGDMVWRLALARTGKLQDAEDIFQEVFLRFFRHEGRLTTAEHQKAWLIRCTVNRAKSLASAPWRRRVLPMELAAQLSVPEPDRAVYAAVLALPAPYRTVIHLHYFEGLSVAEIAAACGCTQGTVKSRLSRGRGLLRASLKEVDL